jgi:DNA-binding transcriptional regulator YiaG
MKTRTLYGIGGLDYVEVRSVPVRSSADKELGDVIVADMGDLERRVSSEIIRQRLPLRGKEVLFLRKALGMSMEKFANHLGLTAASILKWERTSGKRLGLINEFAVRGFIAERLKLDTPVRFSDLSDTTETPAKLVIGWELSSKAKGSAA